ncbi:MAG: hypothetical protein ACJAYR_001556 [Sneathiella sp.]|jgi:hypothetical protein
MATFGGNGRYKNSKILTIKSKNNEINQYLSRRFIPQYDPTYILGSQIVQTGDRPDLVAYRAYESSTSFYLIADYNLSVNPFSLTIKPGRPLIIPSNTTI